MLSRPVIAFALLSQCSQILRTDLIGGIALLVRPLVRGLQGQRFSAEVLSKKLGESYGVAISPQAIEDFLPRFEQAGLVEVRRLSESANEAIFKEVEGQEDIPYEQDFQEVIDKFKSFAQHRLGLIGVSIPESELTLGLLSRLATYNFSAIGSKPDRSQRDSASESRLLGPSAREELSLERAVSHDARLDVLVASFIAALEQADAHSLELVSRVAEGALGAELVFDLRAPQVRSDLSQITVVLDTPLVLSLLDLSDRQNHRLASELVRQIRESKASLGVFQHSIDEAESVLKAVKNGLLFGDAYGPTAERMRDSTYIAFFQTMIGAIKQRLIDAGFRVIPPTRDLAFQHFPKADEEGLANRLRFGIGENRLARERDALSIAETIRLRAGVRVNPSQIESCRYLFLTSNPLLQQQAIAFLITNKLFDRGDFPPVVTDRTYCGLSWLLFGGAIAGELPIAKLLANCANALRSRPDVVRKTKAFLEKLDASKAKHFETLMTNERAARYLTEVTLGDSLLVTQENADQIYEQLEALAGEKVARAKDEYYGQKLEEVGGEVTKLTAQLEDAAAEREALATTLARTKAEGQLRANEAELFSRQLNGQAEELDRHRSELTSLKGDLGRLDEAVHDARRALEYAKERAVEVSAAEARRRKAVLEYGVLIVFLVFAWVLGYIDKFILPGVSPDYIKFAQYGLIALQVAVAGIGFWVFTDKLFAVPIGRSALRCFNTRLRELGYGEPGPEFSVDTNTFAITKVS